MYFYKYFVCDWFDFRRMVGCNIFIFWILNSNRFNNLYVSWEKKSENKGGEKIEGWKEGRRDKEIEKKKGRRRGGVKE